MSRGPTVTVAGAGALGLCCALALADAGCAVTVCEPGKPRASMVAAGMLAPAFEAVLEPEIAGHADLLFAARNLWPAVEARAAVALDRSGALAVGDDAWLDNVAAGLIRLGLHPAEVGRTTIDMLGPSVAPPDPFDTDPPAVLPTFQRGLLLREDWRLDSRPALVALRAACETAGVAFEARRVMKKPTSADILVLAVGYDLSLADLAPELAALSPIRGQILRYGDVNGGGVCIRSPWGYAAPSSDGLAFGATMEVGCASLERDVEAMEASVALLDGSGSLLTHPDAYAQRLEMGIRAATPDGLPLVGWSQTPGVVLATGARRNGWLLAPLVGQIVAACVTGRDAGPFAARLDPRRFGGVR